MTRPRTFLLAAAMAAALALAGCGGSDETSGPANPPPAPATETEPTTTEAETEPATTEAETEPAETETEPVKRADVDVFIQVTAGERIGGKGRIEATQGDRVRIEIAVDAAQEFHLHAYDLTRNATPSKPALFEFEAELEGIFALESHASEAIIVDLVVEP